MLDVLIEEFITIATYLTQHQKSILKKGYLFVEKEFLVNLLKQNAYLTPEEKLIIWRDLGWIETDPGHLTSRLRVDGQRIRKIQIHLLVVETLKKWR